jgi:hypothetical protein
VIVISIDFALSCAVGGVRAVQFLSGGWVDKNLPSGTNRVSSTYVFPSDIGPTLLEMAGGNEAFLLRGLTGATYGNSMWEYLKSSVDASKPKSAQQKVRKVSYNKDMFFDIQVDKTLKNIFTGKIPQWTPRLWEPVFPKNGDLVMDSTYYSVQPCRPNGVPSDCCLLNIEDDWQENHPLPANCQAMGLEGKQLFAIEGGCPKNSQGQELNPLCVKKGGVQKGAVPLKYSLWSHYGAGGPFTNSKGVPIDDFPMKCACYAIDPKISKSAVNFFTLPLFSLTECVNRNDYNFILQGVACDGTFSFNQSLGDWLQEFSNQGFDPSEFKKIVDQEDKQRIILDIPALVDNYRKYSSRVGHTEWPNFGKLPYVIDGLDTCSEKGISPVPWPLAAITPYMLGIRDPTTPREAASKIGLCAINALDTYFCPSHDNPLLEPVQEWNFGSQADGSGGFSNVFDQGGLFGKNGFFGTSGLRGIFSGNGDRNLGVFNKRLPGPGVLHERPYGTFANGKLFKPMTLIECSFKCPNRAKGTAYIGNGPHGLTV